MLMVGSLHDSDNKSQIEFRASLLRHFDHGDAVTSHSSQGLTAERVLVHADNPSSLS
jgi:ATP-dependent exoDNAse (exonuclease V) alpha subunit